MARMVTEFIFHPIYISKQEPYEENMKKHETNILVASLIFSALMLLSPMGIRAQDNEEAQYEPDTLISAAKELMKTARYCALITLDKYGHPQVRTMDPFPPEDNMVVWLGTNTNSRKVKEIRNDSRVSLYYEAPDATGYVVIQGRAYLKDDPENITKHWKEEWDRFYPDKSSMFMLIKVVPEKLEIIDYTNDINASPLTWTVPNLEFE